jgi:hypothetical protein
VGLSRGARAVPLSVCSGPRDCASAVDGVRDRIARVVKQMREGGASWRNVGEALGVPLETVRRIWVEREGSRAGFVAVEVAPEIRRGEISLVTTGGHRVEGLDVETVAVLLARLA